MGDRPNEAGSWKALSGVLGVRFSGHTGRIPRLFGLRAAGANTLLKAYHVWSRGTGVWPPTRLALCFVAILLRLDLARLSTIGWLFFVLSCSSVPCSLSSPHPFAERCDPPHSSHLCARTYEALSRKGRMYILF